MILPRRPPPHPALFGTVQDITREVAQVVASYRRELVAGGMPDAEAWALAQRLEERLLGPVYDQAEAELQPAPWEDIEALFVAVVNLQLVLGQAPDAQGAVAYMRAAGVRIPPDVPRWRCMELAERVPVSEDLIREAFAPGAGPE